MPQSVQVVETIREFKHTAGAQNVFAAELKIFTQRQFVVFFTFLNTPVSQKMV